MAAAWSGWRWGMGTLSRTVLVMCLVVSRVATKAAATGPFKRAAMVFGVHAPFGHKHWKFWLYRVSVLSVNAASFQGPTWETRTAFITALGCSQDRSHACRWRSSFLSQR